MTIPSHAAEGDYTEIIFVHAICAPKFPSSLLSAGLVMCSQLRTW